MIELDFTVYLIVCPLVGLAGFVDAIAGGGGFISLPAYLISGIPPINAIATNKITGGIIRIVPLSGEYISETQAAYKRCRHELQKYEGSRIV